MRTQVWATLNDTKFKGYSLSLLVDQFQRLDRRINIFLAIASSGSIAAWAVWKEHPLVWSSIIAFSQVVTVVKPYFPYFKYVKELNAKCHKIAVLNIELERLWYKIQHKKLTEDLAEKEYYDLRRTIADALIFGDDVVFVVSRDIEKKANEKMRIYLKSHYGVIIETK